MIYYVKTREGGGGSLHLLREVSEDTEGIKKCNNTSHIVWVPSLFKLKSK